MLNPPTVGIIVVALALLAWAHARARQRRAIEARLLHLRFDEVGGEAEFRAEDSRVLQPAHRGAFPVIPLAVAGGVALALSTLTPLPTLLSVALGVVCGTIAWLVGDFLRAQREARIESQLVDANDLIISGLRAGSGLVDSLETAARQMALPTAAYFDEVVQRLRLGDEPTEVFEDFARHQNSEGFRLFSFSLLVHQKVGGSLAPTLASVGRAIRDRLESNRRLRTQTAEAKFSVLGILLITYAVAAILVVSQPDRMEGFFRSTVGAWAASLAVGLQALGLFWMARLTRVRH